MNEAHFLVNELIVMCRIFLIKSVRINFVYQLSQPFIFPAGKDQEGYFWSYICHQLCITEPLGYGGLYLHRLFWGETYFIFYYLHAWLVSFVFICCPIRFVFTDVFTLYIYLSGFFNGNTTVLATYTAESRV